MMSNAQFDIALSGERTAMGGYLPQYDEFAIKVYEAIELGDLEEIRVADREENVGKLDDIVYVTSHDVFAYQVKWTTIDDTMSYLDFKALIPDIVKGWRNLKHIYPDKTVWPKLLTNKLLSTCDHSIIKLAGKKVGGFAAFEKGVLRKLKNREKVESRWQAALNDLRAESTLTETEWDAFWQVFTFSFDYHQELIEVAKAYEDDRIDDIIHINRLIQELVARKGVNNPIGERDIFIKLGWLNRFEPIFEHNLVVPEESYVPNALGIAQLNACLKGKTKGYLFLKGSPGSGKSTLLTQWTRRLANPSVRFYAFDFLNPSSQRNDSSRGSGTTFLNDIVVQINKAGFDSRSMLPSFKDLSSLKERFYEQMHDLSKKFAETGVPFLVIVDGLDHITREYTDCAHTLMRVLPSPSDIPDGVVFVLGSQHFDHLNLDAEIEKESAKKTNLVEMPPLSKMESDALCRKLIAPELITDELLVKCWRKSQGHPLYLHYLLNQIANEGVDVINFVDDAPEGVEDYYQRITGTLLEEKAALNNALGLISRISGVIKFDDVRSLCTEDNILDIRHRMWHLFRFDKGGQELSFFHNSFRQYLLDKTAIDVLTGDYSKEKDMAYYKKLSEHYYSGWGRGYYLYKAGEYDQFVDEITPEHLYAQAQNYRPLWSIRHDMEYGVEIAKQRKDPYLVVRYLLLENQLSQMDSQDYSVMSLTKEFVWSGRCSLAKSILREGLRLYCSQTYAMTMAMEFCKAGDKDEGALLFDLSYPEFLSPGYNERKYQHNDYREQRETLELWVRTAGYFLDWEEVENHIDNFVAYCDTLASGRGEVLDKERRKRGFINEYLDSLAEQGQWGKFDKVLGILATDKNNRLLIYNAYDTAIEQLNELASSNDLLQSYYDKAKNLFLTLDASKADFLRMAYIATKAKQPDDEVKAFIDKVSWKDLGSFYLDRYHDNDFDALYSHIFYISVRAKLGYDDEMLKLVPDDNSKPENRLMVSYARRVFTIAQMTGRAFMGQYDTSYLSHVKYSIRSYDALLNPTLHDLYAYQLSKHRGDFYEFVVDSAKVFGDSMLSDVAKAFAVFFAEATCGADAHSQRKAIMAFYKVGYDKEWCKTQLLKIEANMLYEQDINGREEEALRQGRAWLEVGCYDKAEVCFHQMLEESFGIGYRKDYQPSMFAEWIGDSIRNDSENAVECIHWLTSRLKYIESVAESRTRLYAAKELLNETLSFNLRSGLKLAIWQLDKEYNYFLSVSSSLLVALSDRAQTEEEFQALLHYFTTIHLYTDDNYSYDLDTDVLSAVVNCGKRVLGEAFMDMVPFLKQKIQTECPENISSDLMKKFDEMLVEPASEEKKTDRECEILCMEAKALLAEGRKDEAWDKAIKAVEASNSSGWNKFYDGGTRIKACSVLQEVDEARGRDVTLELFANDILNGYSYGTSRYLDESFPLLTKTVDHKRLFAEEFAYMKRIMREGTVCEEDKPEINPDDSSVCEIIRDWLLFLANTPIVCVMERSKMLLAHLYNESRVDLIGSMSGNFNSTRTLLEIGCYLVELKSSRLADFKDLAIKSAVSENYQFRIYAAKILNALGEPIPKAPRKTLPVTYSLVFTETQEQLLDFSHEKNDVTKINWRDASSIMKIASHWSDYLSELSGIDSRTLDYRAVELMNKYEEVAVDYVQQNEWLGRHYNDIGLRYSFKKAHVQAALDGMLAVVAELKDAGVIRYNYMDSVFASRDFRNIIVEATGKPDFIQRIADPKSWSVDKEWIKESRKSPRFTETLPLYKDLVVIGEITHIKKMGDNNPVEEYQSKISFFAEKEETFNGNFIFGYAPFMHETSDYLRLGWKEPELILIRSGYYTDFPNKSHWIAINPALAALLELSPCKDGYFAWEDERGEKMVESVYWQSGNINGSSGNRYEASEGWLVVANPKIMEKLITKEQVYIHKYVMRRMENNPLDISHYAYVVKEY